MSIVYQDIIARFWKNRTSMERIKIDVAKRILGSYYHFNKKKYFLILGEMQKMKLLKYSNGDFIIVWRPPKIA